ncbi:isochorismate synthase DhbC [Saccharothrix violaceirubra]|uniref:isochorismate synthase n=1 Tax=Saccharothrix violaceirubra TaxID=413306 RepID=A0A7W7WXE2_9PSEU|nr:isochorismate synthase [Saccharothrix violaceirubra]MBB4967021.1 isochorismate synthase [Saccharothrix violaceirubra]
MLAADTPSALSDLDTYREGGFFFASPTGVLVAEDAGTPAPERLAPGSVLVGALPFRPDRPARLTVPALVRRGAALHTVALPASPTPGGRWLDQRTDATAYTDGVARALRHMADGDLNKVVLARALDLTAAEPIDVRQVLAALAARDPHGYTFATDLGGSTLIGTSPELLVRRTGTAVVSNPLAGSRPRSTDPEQDGRNATELLVSTKDQREHALVVQAIADGLAPFCRRLDVPSTPELLPTRTMWHLSTRVTGELRSGETTSLDLASALHPTPAVCGVPVEAARSLIGEVEPFDRGYYTGVVGWTDDRGDGEWVVAIRCGEVADRTLRLYAGAGVVPGSTPAAELAETSAKFRTFLGALGLKESA